MATLITSRNDDLLSRARLAGYDPGCLDATVLIVGMGALGQNTGLNLALSGVRELRVVDADRFEEHNRTRSPLYPPTGGSGASKAVTTGAALRAVATHPDAAVRYAHAWIEDLGLAVFDGVDVVVSCVDTLRGRAYLADVCRLLSIPLIEAGFNGADVTWATYPAATTTESEALATPCWRCGKVIHDQVLSCRARAAAAERLGTVPAIQTAAAVLGGFQAEAVVEVLHGRNEAARRVWLDIRSGESIAASLSAHPDCSGCHQLYPAATPIPLDSGATIAEILAYAPEGLGPRAFAHLRSEWMNVAPCVTCAEVVAVGAPSHRYVRDPHCSACSGPWAPVVLSGPAPKSLSVIRAEDPDAERSAAELGYARGDSVYVQGQGAAALLRLRGGADDFLRED